MSDSNIILFVPRSNQKADRAFWKGPEPDPLAVLAIEIMNQAFLDTPAEYTAPMKDPA